MSAGEPGIDLVLNGYPLGMRQMGTGTYVASLIRGLLRCAPERKFRVVVPETFRRMVAAEFPAELFEFVRARLLINRSIACDIQWSLSVARHVARRYPEAVFHSPAHLWAPWRPRRTVVTYYDCVYRHFPRLQGGWVRSWWWRAAERYARRADRVLAISQFARLELIRHAGVARERIRVIYPWVDTFDADEAQAGEANARAAARYQLPPEYLLYVGGYNCNKNVERLIAAYARARTCAALPPLVLAGAIPPSDPRLAVCDVPGALAAEKLTANEVKLIGAVASHDLPAIFRGAKLFIAPSLHEGFGYPAAEAIAVGTPVIASASTGLAEVVRDPRGRFDPLSIEAIAAKILEANAAPGKFRWPLPAEFTERAGVAAYLAVLGELGTGARSRKPV